MWPADQLNTRVVELTVHAVEGRVPVIAELSGQRLGIEMAQAVERAGADGIRLSHPLSTADDEGLRISLAIGAVTQLGMPTSAAIGQSYAVDSGAFDGIQTLIA